MQHCASSDDATCNKSSAVWLVWLASAFSYWFCENRNSQQENFNKKLPFDRPRFRILSTTSKVVWRFLSLLERISSPLSSFFKKMCVFQGIQTLAEHAHRTSQIYIYIYWGKKPETCLRTEDGLAAKSLEDVHDYSNTKPDCEDLCEDHVKTWLVKCFKPQLVTHKNFPAGRMSLRRNRLASGASIRPAKTEWIWTAFERQRLMISFEPTVSTESETNFHSIFMESISRCLGATLRNSESHSNITGCNS